MNQFTVRLSDREKKQLERFCAITDRTANDIIRDCVRHLAVTGELDPLYCPPIPPNSHLTHTYESQFILQEKGSIEEGASP